MQRPQTPQGNPGPAWQDPLLFSSRGSFQNRRSDPHQPGCCWSCVCPPLGSLLSQAKPDKAQKTKGLGAARKSSGFVCSSCPRPRRQPQGQIWACQEIHAQSLVNFGWDSGLGFSKGHMGGAGDFVPEAPLVPGEVSGQVPPFSLPRPWIPCGLYLVALNS